jgi:hypothetical protein
MTPALHVTGCLDGYAIRDADGEIVGVFASISEAWEARATALRLSGSINLNTEGARS